MAGLTNGKVYKLINLATATILTMNIYDKNVSGWTDMDRDNQKWRAFLVNGNWVFASLYRDPSAPATPIHLNVNGRPNDPNRVIGSTERLPWNLQTESGVLFGIAPLANTGLRINLENGNSGNDTPVFTRATAANTPSQSWVFQEIQNV